MGESIDVYRDLCVTTCQSRGSTLTGTRYYEGGVSSVYFWDLDDGFAGVVLLKKSMSKPPWMSCFHSSSRALRVQD